MKKIILSLAWILGATLAANCQKVQTDSKGNYFAVKTVKDSAGGKPTPTGKTYTDISGNVYPVLISKNGKLFCKRISKAGKEYNYYLQFTKK